MIYLYKIISFFLAFIVVSISFYVVYVIYVYIAKCVEKIKIWINKNAKYNSRMPSEEYLKKQRDNMEDLIWNRMGKNNQNK